MDHRMKSLKEVIAKKQEILNDLLVRDENNKRKILEVSVELDKLIYRFQYLSQQ